MAVWPADWGELYSGERCPLCDTLRELDNDHSLLIRRGDWVDVRLDRRSGVCGYAIAIWNRGHAVELADLDAAELAGFWAEVTEVGAAVGTAFTPKKLNYQVLGNSVPHLHCHVLPRYEEDPSPGGPLPWDDVVAGRFSEAELREQADRITARLPDRR